MTTKTKAVTVRKAGHLKENRDVRGKAPINIEEYYDKISPFLKIGLSVQMACYNAGVPFGTVRDYMRPIDDVTPSWLGERIAIDMKFVSMVAQQNLTKLIQGGDPEASKWWLERKERKDFSTRTEVDKPDDTTDEVINASKELKKLIEDVRIQGQQIRANGRGKGNGKGSRKTV
jgi:hypothetical protein